MNMDHGYGSIKAFKATFAGSYIRKFIFWGLDILRLDIVHIQNE